MLSQDGIGSVCEQVPNWILVSKGLQDSARGFNPGNSTKKGARPNGAEEGCYHGFKRRKFSNGYLSPLQGGQAARRLQFGLGAVLPQLRQPNPTFEHEHDFDAPGEGGSRC
jgi:hypothetical protein